MFHAKFACLRGVRVSLITEAGCGEALDVKPIPGSYDRRCLRGKAWQGACSETWPLVGLFARFFAPTLAVDSSYKGPST